MKKIAEPIRTREINRAYVPAEADRARMAKLAGLEIDAVKTAEKGPPPRTRGYELLAVFDLTVFGNTRKEIAAAVAKVQALGGDIIEIEIGNICGGGVAAMDRADSILWGRSRKGHPGLREGQAKSVAARTAGRKVDRDGLFELWGSGLNLAQIIDQSGWAQASIYAAMKDEAGNSITRDQARKEIANRLRAMRKPRR